MGNNDLKSGLGRIVQQTMPDIVEIRLREYLKEKSFKPGDALPKETDLAESLGVSRNVVREALSRLRMLGMVETKKKRGMVLTSPDILSSFERVLDPLIIGENTLKDIFELRLVLEMGLAELIYARRTEKDVKELKEIALGQMDGKKENFRIKNEIEFHGKLYEMSGNDTLKRFQNMLLPIFDYVIKTEPKFISGKVSHMDLAVLLEKGSKEEFREGMYEHLKPHFDRLKRLG
jgi:GntR family transcriptional regulator, transcriptional repressor for pyruvate dehydrogenase complex